MSTVTPSRGVLPSNTGLAVGVLLLLIALFGNMLSGMWPAASTAAKEVAEAPNYAATDNALIFKLIDEETPYTPFEEVPCSSDKSPAEMKADMQQREGENETAYYNRLMTTYQVGTADVLAAFENLEEQQKRWDTRCSDQAAPRVTKPVNPDEMWPAPFMALAEFARNYRPTLEQSCTEEFTQKWDPNVNGRFVSDGLQTVEDDLKRLRADARYLATRAQVLGLTDTYDYESLVTEGNKCLNRKGQELYFQVKGALTGTGVEIDESGEAPADGYNTAMVDDKPVIDPEPGIGGDREAIVYTLRDDSRLFVKKNCGNVVFPEKVTYFPKGKTEHLRPDTPSDTDEAPPTSPPAQPPSGPALQPKSKDPNVGYTVDEGSPSAGKGGDASGTEASQPSRVETSVTSPSSGITDTPTNQPGSETGITAPGADGSGSSGGDTDGAPPTQEPGDGESRHIPPPEDGAYDPSQGGGEVPDP